MTEQNGVRRSSATDELRRLLDERGVEWTEPTDEYWELLGGIPTSNYVTIVGGKSIEEATDGTLVAYHLTPEQAVAATVGGGECIPHGEWKRISQTQEVRHVFCECGYELGMDERDSFPFECTRLFAMPNYCQECGRKIRKAVKR